MMIPVLRQIGKRENARASFVSSVISPLDRSQRLSFDPSLPVTITHMAAFKMAMLPLNKPLSDRARHIWKNVVLNPKATAEAADPIHPCSRQYRFR